MCVCDLSVHRLLLYVCRDRLLAVRQVVGLRRCEGVRGESKMCVDKLRSIENSLFNFFSCVRYCPENFSYSYHF